MHKVIRAVVFAQNKAEALDKAKDVFDQLCGDDKTFDYYILFNENSPMSGKARWGNLPAVARADSPEGKQLIEEGMRLTREGFMKNIQRVRRGLALFSDEELLEEKLGPKAIAAKEFDADNRFNLDYDPGMIKYAMHHCYLGTGVECWLYDSEGSVIDTPRHLANVLSKWRVHFEDENKPNPLKGLKVFIVPADVHY